MTRWNPGNPDVAGDEWYGSTAGVQQIALLLGRGPAIIARATQTVDELRALVRKISGTAQVNLAADVYDLANPVGPDTQSWAMCLPVANHASVATWVMSIAGVESAYGSTAYQHVDDVIGLSGSVAIGTSDQLRYQGVNPATAPAVRFRAGNTFYDGDSGAAGASITNKRISSVEVVCVVENFTPQSVTVAGQIVLNSTTYNADSGNQVVSATPVQLRRLRFVFYWNPETGLPWTNADAVALTDGTASNAFGVAIANKAGAGSFVITACWLSFRVLTERRVACGYASSVAPDEWVPIPLLDPADNTSQSWSKVSGHEYLILYSLTKDSGPAGVSQIDTSSVSGLAAQALTDAAGQVWTLDRGAVPYYHVSDLEAQIPTLLMVGAAVSADSLPYGAIEVGEAGNAGAVLKQAISTHSTQAYGTAKLLVSRGSGGQDAGLVVRLKKTSDNSVLAGPNTIAVADVPADGKYHPVALRFTSPASLTSGTGVYLEVQSTSNIPWLLPALATRTATIDAADATSVAAAAAGIGGTTDKGDATTTRDYPWAISLAPSPPGSLGSSVLTQANKPALSRHTVIPATVGYAHLTWAATSIGGSFGYYEIQRQDGADWVTIVLVDVESVTHYNSIDCARNVASSFRIRAVRDDGGMSAWANFPAVTVTTVSPNDVVIASDWDHDLALAFADVSDLHEWPQRRDERRTTKDYYGREFPVVWVPPENSGETFARDLLIGDDDDPNIISGALARDRAIFDDVLALCQASTVPSLVYCDGYGCRWNVSVACQPSTQGAYIARVTCTQVAVPAPVETSAPW